MKESKSTERTRMEEQLCDFFVYFLSVDFSSFLFLFFFFFLNWPHFQTSLLQEEKSNRFSKALISEEPLQSPSPSKKSQLNLQQCSITQ